MTGKILKILFIFLLFLFFVWTKTNAAGENLNLDIIPEIPGPNQDVIVSVSSYSYDLDRASITWFLNGQKKLTGIGEKSFSFKTGEIGSNNNISVSIYTSDGVQINKSLNFKPASVDLLWTALNYTPSFYKGRALPSFGSLVKFTVIPHFSNNSNLVYDWSSGYKKFPSSSGLGKSSFTFMMGNDLSAEEITVTVSNYDQSELAVASVNVVPVETEIVFYKDDPLKGPQYNNVLSGEFSLTEENIILRAEPFYFSISDLTKLVYDWFMNDNSVKAESLPNELSLNTGGQSGSSDVGLNLSNSSNLFQYATNNIKFNY